MKPILLALLLTLGINAFGQGINERWEKVLELEYQGDIKKATEITGEIYAQAVKERLEGQIVKVFFFQAKYIMLANENARVKVINNLKAEIKKASPATAALLQNIYAGILSDYYYGNVYRINERKAIVRKRPENMEDWTANEFNAAIAAACKKSLENRALLLKTPLTDYESVIDFNAAMATTKRPLYDFLAEQYINYSKKPPHTNDIYPAEKLPLLYGSTDVFLSLALPKEAVYMNMDIMQQLEAFYKKTGNTAALEMSALRRIKYLYTYTQNTDRETYYTEALKRCIDAWGNSAFGYRAMFNLAEFYSSTATEKNHPEYRQEALKLCNSIIENSKLNDITPEAINLKNSITRQTVHLKTEKYVQPGKPALAFVGFSNTDTLSIKIYRVPAAESEINPNLKKSGFSEYPLVLEKKYILPNSPKHFAHTTEIVLPELAEGTYAIQALPSGQTVDSDIESRSFFVFTATNIALTKTYKGNHYTYTVYHRETGAPLRNVKVSYLGKQLTTNNRGMITINTTEGYEDKRTQVLFSIAGDTLVQSYEKSRYDDDNHGTWVNASATLYTDRAMYRPGQTVYFKGVLYKRENNKASVVPNVFVSVTAEDDNGDEIAGLRLETNEFGSFSGEFKLPMGKTGRFTLNADKDDEKKNDPAYNKNEGEHPFWDALDFYAKEHYFRVEEYRRPTFEIAFNPVKELYKLGDSITVSGVAKSFSKAPVSGARVVYRVLRCNDRYYYEEDMANTYNEMLEENDLDDIHEDKIGEGETTTDAGGNFSITFKAEDEEDYYINDEKHRKFNFLAIADITDINGETRRERFTLKAGNYILEHEAIIAGKISAIKEATITLKTNNLNGQFTPAKGRIAIYKNEAAARLLTERPWQQPEIQTISREDFIKTFPYTPYDNKETQMTVGDKAYFEQEVNTAADKKLTLKDFKGWPEGEYTLVFTAADSTGTTEEQKSTFVLERPESTLPPDSDLYQFEIKNGKYRKTGHAEFSLRSALPQLHATLVVMNEEGKILYSENITVPQGMTNFKIPVPKKYDGALTAQLYFLWQNRFFEKQLYIEKEYHFDDFHIEMENVSSRLLPDSKQVWNVKLKTNNKKAEAELLAGMYDAALDELVKTDWKLVNDYYFNSGIAHIRTPSMLTKYTASSYYERSPAKTGHLIYKDDRLYWFGFNINRVSKSTTDYILHQAKRAGDYVITGTINDSQGMGLPNATIVVKGTNEGTVTDLDGHYVIYVSPGEDVQVSFVGFMSKTIKPTASGIYNINLEQGSALENIVVDSYRTLSHSKSAVAAATVTSRTIEGRPNATFIETLQGQVPGLNIASATGQPGANTTVILRGSSTVQATGQPMIVVDGKVLTEKDSVTLREDDITDLLILDAKEAAKKYGSNATNGAVVITSKESLENLKNVRARKNFNETAFFYPLLHPDRKGNINFSFTVPESLTSWKLRLLAHQKDTRTAYLEKMFFTQKNLMVVPNMPRFLRETDTVTIKAKVTNLTTEAKTGSALLQLYNATTMAEADAVMGNTNALQSFSIGANGSTIVSWTITIPEGIQGVQYRIVAKSGEYSDGEENILPVLPNSILVTESIPLWVREHSKKQFTLENFKANTSTTLRHQAIVLEYTGNPAWIALQSLPYLMEYEHECSEQTFARYYANTIAHHIMHSNPKIAAVFDQWRKNGKASRMDNDPQLRSILLAETPWLMEMENKAERDNRLALLMDLDKMSAAQQTALDKLDDKQLASGAFPWFSGGIESEYITRHILAGFGHLTELKTITKADNLTIKKIINKALTYTDSEFFKRYQMAKKSAKKGTYNFYNPYADLHYLYTRSYYLKSHPLTDSLKVALAPSLKEVKNNWRDYSLYQKGMASLILHRYGDTAEAKKVLHYLKGTSASNTDWGMYWIDNNNGRYWYNAPIETQTLLIEAFSEAGNDTATADALKVWLLKQKQATHWPTTKSTTEAVYAVLMQGNNWLSAQDKTSFTLGNEKLLTEKITESGSEAASGYMKLQWKPEEITKNMATLTVENKGDVPGFGGLYWQYFEQAEKIKPAQEGIMAVSKGLYRKETVNGKNILKPITAESPLTVGEKITVRLEITLKEDAEYVHLKDMRAAGFEPVDVFSGYRYKELTYYQSTRDVATHFFFDYIKKGSYVLEYELQVNTAGQYSNGITTLQSMYAPEYSAHTSGIRIKISE